MIEGIAHPLNKQGRHQAIRQLIVNRVVASQEELRLLLEEDNVEVTQATLSRDIKELGIARVNTNGGTRYVLRESGEQRLASLLALEIESVQANEAMIVVRTLPGRAQGVAESIDSLEDENIIGTLAGDNTIFIAPSSTSKIPQIIEKINRLIARAS